MHRQYEFRFVGKDNAGLRAKIRAVVQVNTPACGPVVESAILAFGRTVALTTSGQHELARCAQDYRMARRDYDPRCRCVSCCEMNWQRLAIRS